MTDLHTVETVALTRVTGGFGWPFRRSCEAVAGEAADAAVERIEAGNRYANRDTPGLPAFHNDGARSAYRQDRYYQALSNCNLQRKS